MAARPFLTGWCEGPNHGHCPGEVPNRPRTVVRNTTGGTRIIELAALTCSCKCHQEETK